MSFFSPDFLATGWRKTAFPPRVTFLAADDEFVRNRNDAARSLLAENTQTEFIECAFRNRGIIEIQRRVRRREIFGNDGVIIGYEIDILRNAESGVLNGFGRPDGKVLMFHEERG